MAKRTIIKNETIPNTGKVLGQTSIVHKAGGNTNTSFNSTDLFNFDVKDEGEIEIKDPQKSYLTTTFYPLVFTDKVSIKAKGIDRAILTDNLYATHGLSDEVKMGITDVSIVYFKRALIVIDYYSNSYAKRDAFRMKASNLTMNLRNVLRTYSIRPENIKLTPKKVSFSIRSVLINYVLYKYESIKLNASKLAMTNRVFSNTFTSLLIGDSKNVGSVVNNDVTMIKDKGQLTWTFSNNMTVDKTARFGENALKMDKIPSYLTSNESLNITSEDGVEIFFEDWIKPATITKTLLTSYGNVSTVREKPLLQDKIDNVLWTVEGTSINTSVTDINLTNNSSIKKLTTDTDLVIENPTTTARGTTLDLNCTVTGTDKIYLLSNNTSTLSTTLKQTFAIVWYGDSTDYPTFKNKIAIVGDDPDLIDANSHMIVSTDNFPTGSDLNITVIFYNMYIKLFINGVLQGVKLINRSFNLGYGGSVRLGKVSWYAYKASHTYKVKAFRITNTALHLTNSFDKGPDYNLKAIPDILKIADPVKYPLGLTCGVRFREETNDVVAFVTITDSNDITFKTESTPLDITKWNYLQIANTASDVTLLVNGVSNGSLILPYNIKFKDIVIGSKETNNYQGKMDNFRISSKIKDESNPLRSSELFFTQNNLSNTLLVDSNPNVKWIKNTTANIVTSTDTTYRGRELVGGLSTNNVSALINPYNFKLKTVLNNKTYKTIADTVLVSSEVSFTNTTETYSKTFNLSTDAIRLAFKVTDTTTSTLAVIGGLTLSISKVSDTTFNLNTTIGSTVTTLPYVFDKGSSYTLDILKMGQHLCIFINNTLIAKANVLTVLNGSNIVLGPFTGSASSLIVGDNTSSVLIDNQLESEGFISHIYEPFSNVFAFDCYFETTNRAVSENLVSTGYNTVEFIYKSKMLSLSLNGIESEQIKSEFVSGNTVVNILRDNKTPLAYVQGITSSQDALLPVPYQIDTIFNETVYSKAVIALSTDSNYENNYVFDRNSNGLAKDVINVGVTKGIIEPGFFFNGDNNYLKIKSDDFAFESEDFYMEFEVYLNSLNRRAVILDRYLAEAGSWQISINTDGHLYWTITTAGSYYFIDIPVGIVPKEWFKIQVSRKGTTFKFYLDDILVYEYDPGTVVVFSKKGVDLHIGYQGTAVNTAYNLNGYINNIRIVKGLSMDIETDEESKIVEKIKENPSHKAVSDAVEELTGSTSWTLDAPSNQIKYTKVVVTYHQAGSATMYDTYKAVCDASNYEQWGIVTPEPVNGHVGECGKLSEGVGGYSVYKDSISSELSIPLSVVAQKVITNSELGDVDAISFVGEKVLVPEQYDIYKTSSDTLFNIYSKDKAFYDSKMNTWTGSASVMTEEGKAPYYDQWIKAPSNITTTVNTSTFSNSSEFLLEGSFVLTGQGNFTKNLFALGSILAINIQANNAGLDVWFNNVKYSLTHLFRDEVWTKIAICYKNAKLFVYLDDFKYYLDLPEIAWSSPATSFFTVFNGNTRYEAIKLSTKCPYKYSKGKDNLYLDTHMVFEKNKKDNGNKLRTVTLTDTLSTVANKPFYGLYSEAFKDTSLLTIQKGLDVDRKPFTIEFDILFNNLNVRENIFSMSNNGVDYVVYKDIDNKIKASITFEEDTVIYENNLPITEKTWIKLNISKDLGNVFSLGVNKNINYFSNFNYSIVESDILVGGFNGNIYELKIFGNYTVASKVGINVLKLDFEKDSLTTNYVTDTYNGKLLTNNNVTLIKGLSKTSDFVGYFDGITSYLSMGKEEYLNFGKDTFEISFSIYPASGVNDFQTIIASGSDTFTTDSFFVMMYGSNQPSHIAVPATNRLGIGFGITPATNPFLLSNAQLAYNIWTEVKITRIGNTYNLYLNDVLDKSVQIDSSFNLNFNGTLIGKNKWDGAKGLFQGYLDNIKIARLDSYRESTEIDTTEGLISGLDFEEVGAGYDVVESELDGNTVDMYSNAWVLGRYDTTSDIPYYRTVSAINDAIYFKNKGFMYCYNKHFAMGLDPFTVSIDFNQTRRSSSDAYLIHVYGLYAIVITSAGYLEVDFGGTRTRIGLANLDTFYTIAVTRDATYTSRIFLDGKLVTTLADSKVNYNFGTGTIYPMCLGTRFDTRTSSSYVGNYFTGYLDNFIFDRNKCRYTTDYAVFIDKSERIKNSSFVEFTSDGVTSFPDLATPSLQWTSSGITTTSVGNKYTTFAGQNLATGSYMNSTAHGWQLGYQDFSLDLIFKPRQTTAETCLLDLSLNTGITEGIRVVQHNSSTSAITVEIGSTGSASWTLSMTTGVNTLVANTVYHLRVVRNLGTIYLYLNGVLKDSKNFEEDINIGSTLSLYNNRARTRGFTGTIEQFRFIKGTAVTAVDTFTPILESLK